MPDSLPLPGYRMAIIPAPIQAGLRCTGWLANLLVTDVGYFPRAQGHQRERPHGCDQLIIMVCLAGRGWCRFGEQPFEVTANTFVVLPTKQPHAYGADPTNPWTIWWIHLAGSQIEPMQRELSWLQAGVHHLAYPKPLVRLFARCLAELEHGHDQPRLHNAAMVAWQLIGSLGEIGSHETSQQTPDGVALAIRQMHEHLDRPLTVAGLAKTAGWSPSHFAATFKSITGVGPIDYVLRLRMERAAWLLDNSGDDIATIAQQLGYDDPFYFSRRFRAHHGCAPSEYRSGRR